MRLPAIFPLGLVVMSAAGDVEVVLNVKDTGYRGIWYSVGRLDNEYVYKYSGGLGTYCSSHNPHAVYAPEANKTFFVYGGTRPGERALLACVGRYDHASGKAFQPTILVDKGTDDAHDNPVLALGDGGYLWVFVSAHGAARPAYILRSRKPYDIEAFDLVEATNYSYPQPWHFPGRGFLLLHTRYEEGGRSLFGQSSPDGRVWSVPQRIARVAFGHYAVSWPFFGAGKAGMAFNYHPDGFRGESSKKGLDYRTNVYYCETRDMGESWRNVQGEALGLPLRTVDNPALVRDYEGEGLLCYLLNVAYDVQGNPAILHVTSTTWVSGPADRWLRVAYWDGAVWRFREVCRVDSNYDMGSLYIEADGVWRIVAPTVSGPQAYNPGGEMALWISGDRGVTWSLRRQLTRNSLFNHAYARVPLNAHSDFYAFWADGHGRRPSESRLYFCDRSGRKVWRLPHIVDGAWPAAPERVK